MSAQTVLIVEDDQDIYELLSYNLAKEGFEVHHAFNGESGLQKAFEILPTLVILDLMLPGINGYKVCQKLNEKESTKKIPIIMLSAKNEEQDRIKGLELGADDYLSKPFSPGELIARVRALLRRVELYQDGSFQNTKTPDVDMDIQKINKITINHETHTVFLEDREIKLTLAEFKLLSKLGSKKGRVYTRDQLLQTIAGNDTFLVDRNIDVHIRSLRKKLGSEASMIETVRGVGYRCKA